MLMNKKNNEQFLKEKKNILISQANSIFQIDNFLFQSLVSFG